MPSMRASIGSARGCSMRCIPIDRGSADRPIAGTTGIPDGRFPGFGTIRMHAPNHFHVALRQPVVLNRVCRSADEVYDLLRKLELKALGQ